MTLTIQDKKKYNSNYYKKNKEKIDLKNKEYKNKNKEWKKQYDKIYRIKRREENPEIKLLESAKSSAKKQNISFNLLIEDINIPKLCPYLNIPLTNIQGKGKINTNCSIDRIDSSKGYIKGNIQIISYLANKMKQDASIEQLIEFAKNILKHHANIK